jgi:mono/diheme cytochrome c family protein
MKRTRVLLVALSMAATAVLGACADTDTPELSGDQADDAQLVTGRDVFQAECARCHGGSGGGGAGPKLSDGRVVERYPDAAEQEHVVREGRGSMPAFGRKLSDEQITAVVRYTREAL